jgi:ubiquinone/menaquinone biosynthesis C-methylase UbiE
MLRLFHLLMESAGGYAFAQVFGFPTVRSYRALVREHIPHDPDRRVLEIGCGIGSSRPLFAGSYTGVDINPGYIERARRTHGGTFRVMDAAEMPFEPNTFDDAVTIATTHHLTDDQLSAMIRQAVLVATRVHVVDAILPISGSWFKSVLFRMDRGRYVRTLDRLCEIVSRNSRLESRQVLEGPLHDVCYIRVSHL